MIALFAVALSGSCVSHKEVITADRPADPRWTRMDSLVGKGLYASARELADSLRTEAQRSGDWRTEFRAWMSAARSRLATGDGMGAVLADMEGRLRELSDSTRPPLRESELAEGIWREEDRGHVPLRQLLHSALGQAYWEHYQQWRWQVLERTPTDQVGEPAEIDTWDQRMYMRRITAHYRASLIPADTLAWIPAAELRELLIEEVSAPSPLFPKDPWTRSGSMDEPSLLDLLARRALAVLRNTETRITSPLDPFRITDPRAFDLFEYFADRIILHQDTLAWELQAMRAMQVMEQGHLRDDDPEALTYATLDRLAFVHERAAIEGHDSLYADALERLRQRVRRVPAFSEATVHLARWRAQRGTLYDPLIGDAWKEERRKAVTLCDEAIAAWPNSFGARNAEALKARLLAPDLQLRTEQAVSPGAPFRALLGYTNLERVHLRVVKDPAGPLDEARHGPVLEQQLLLARPVAAWHVDPPDDGDLSPHHVELPIAGLPLGRYVLIACDADGFRHGVDRIAHAAFQVTGLAMADRAHGTSAEVVVVDRITGSPKQGARVTAWMRTREQGAQRWRMAGTWNTDADGIVRATLGDDQGNMRWSVVDGADECYSGHRWVFPWSSGPDADSLRTFLFTDRAIYRPGQDIHFKGIVTVARGGTTVTKAGHATALVVYDANGQQVDSIPVTTDAHGAFHGRTRAPAGLAGTMRLEERTGSQWVRVEEYKRPSFEVRFDTAAVEARLDAPVRLSGSAATYAGVPLDDAHVRFTVRRSTRMPWWSRGWFPGSGRPEEVATGTTRTDAQGMFAWVFTPRSDPRFTGPYAPIHSYTITAEVTAQGGETRQGETVVHAGKWGSEIDLDNLEALDRSTVDSLPIAVRDLAGRVLDRSIDVRIERLVPPRGAPRPPRPWPRPDRLLPGQEPDPRDIDPVDAEADSTLLDLRGWRSGRGAIPLPGIRDWYVGGYRITIRTADGSGDTLEVRQHFTVFDPGVERSGFAQEAISIRPMRTRAGPGDHAEWLIGTTTPYARVLMQVEREGHIAVTRWFMLRNEQQLVRIPVQEDDLGGFAVHFLAMHQGHAVNSTQVVEVPWDNKELQVEWMRFRDRTMPGAEEEWRLRITGPAREQVAAQVLAAMYDASLDQFVPHAFHMFQWPAYQVRKGWQRVEPIGVRHAIRMHRPDDLPRDTLRTWPEIDIRWSWWSDEGSVFDRIFGGNMRGAGGPGDEGQPMEGDSGSLEMAQAGTPVEQDKPVAGSEPLPAPWRSDFRETGFFFPDLLTDADGEVVLRFTMPEALTRWRILGLAHTPDLKLAAFEREVVTSKPMMVMPNLPRSLRESDRITLTARIDVLEGDTLEGKARLRLIDPQSGKSIEGLVGLAIQEQPFTAAPGASAVVAWNVAVMPGLEAVSIRMEARADGHADGEEHMLPVLSDRVLVTNSLPMSWPGKGVRIFESPALLASGSSPTLRHEGLMLEVTPNPAWQAVQALPYMMEFPHACAEQIFSRFYANALAAHVTRERPAIRKVFDAWRETAITGGPDAFLAALEKNPMLKGIVLEETPWVAQAKDDGERRKRIALLFDLERMAAEQDRAARELRDMQLADGSWPWFSGMGASRWVTQHIVAGFGHLQRTSAADLRHRGEIDRMVDRARDWLGKELVRDHRRRERELDRAERETYLPRYDELHLLYARGFLEGGFDLPEIAAAARYLRERAAAQWTRYGLQEQAMLALILHRAGDHTTARDILASLKERSTRNDEFGMYWKSFKPGMDRQQFPTETFALLIEAFHEAGRDSAAVDGLRHHLLTLKRSTDWGTTTATAAAVHALLLTGPDLLEESTLPLVDVGGERVKFDAAQAGTGHLEKHWDGDRVKPGMGRIRIEKLEEGPMWAALHWRYLEKMDALSPAGGPFSVERSLHLREGGAGGTRLVPLAEARPLVPGDRLTVRVVLVTDRWLDHVHLKDLRAAGLEPVEVLSGAHGQGGTTHYRSIRDAAMHFFFDRLPPGRHVLEYDLRVTHAGDMHHGVATVRCMYAPEFGANSAGMRLKVLPGRP
ncbi:MAG: hypothetical protein KIT10_11320 [Flavobacteriales bacterium]|nr:hypothetical protein [Flavobacteriales bacterium]